MDYIDVSLRKTHKYRAGWYGHDLWEPMATLKMTPPQQVRKATNYDDGGTYIRYARIPAKINKVRLLRSVEQTMSGSNCRHEHDCCGCARRYTEARMIKPRIMKIITNISYNY